MKYHLKISKGKLIGLIILGVFIGLIVYKSGKNPAYEFKSSKTAPQEYLSLFHDSIKNKLSVLQTVIMKCQNPISELYFDNKKYFIQIFKINNTTEQSLGSFVTLSSRKELATNAVTYFQLGSYFNIFYKTGKDDVSHVDLSILGAPVNTIFKNETMACFYSKFKTFSINYNHSDTTSIYSSAKTTSNENENSISSLPIDIVFVKNSKFVYFILMSVTDQKTKLEPRRLYNLILHRQNYNLARE